MREARLRQKIDIAEVETATKIRAKYLRALENEEFDRLPGSTYVRTFLRTYAEFLGLDPHLLVEEYRIRHEPPTVEEVGPIAPAPQRRRRAESGYRQQLGGDGGPGRGAIVAGLVIGVLLLFLIVGLVTGGEEEPTDAGSPVATDASRTEDGGGARKRRERDRKPSGGDEEVELRITPLDATYVCIDDGAGKRVFEGTLASPRTFRSETLLINLGRTSAELELDGKPVEVPQSSTPVGYEFSSDGEQELPAGERPCT